MKCLREADKADKSHRQVRDLEKFNGRIDAGAREPCSVR